MKKGWEYKKLGDITVFSQGIQVDVNLQTETFSPGKVRFLRIIDVTQGNVPPRYIDDPGEKYYLKADEIAMVRYGTIGFVCYGIEGVIANNLFKISIKDKSKLQSSYLQYFLKSDLFQSHIRKSVGGAALPSIKFGDIKHIMLGIPPLSEQKEIVEYLDSSFAKIDKLKENAAKNLEEAKALFQSALKDALEPKEGWEEKTIQNVCEILNGFAFPSASFMNKGCLKVIKITNVGVGEFIEDNSRLSIEHQDNSAKVNENDIVIALTRTIIADGLKKARVPFSYDGALLNQRVAALTPKKNVVENSFVYYYLGTAQVSKYVLSKVNTLMQPNLSIGDLKKMPIPLPSLQEQQSIVSFLDSLSEKVNTLQQNYSRICNECDALKQAILRQVFE